MRIGRICIKRNQNWTTMIIGIAFIGSQGPFDRDYDWDVRLYFWKLGDLRIWKLSKDANA